MADNRFPIKMKWQEGGYRVVVDEHLDENSSNPVANWVLKEAISQGGGGGGGTWGTITGTITDQTDLIQYINAHGAGTWGAITGTLTDQTDLVQYITNALTNYYTKSQVYTKAETDALIPTVNDKTLTVQKNGTDVGTFTANSAQDKTINITVPTTAADVNALPDSTKYGASITVSLDSSTYVLTTTLKDQDGNTLGTAQAVDLPIESVVVSGSYDSATKEVVLVLESGSEIRFSVADLVSGLQPEITSSNKLSADLVDDTSTTHKFTTASDISKLAGIEANANNYVLPAATTSTLGGVKVGEHLEIDANGVLETDVHVALYDEPDDPQPIPPVTTNRIANEAVTLEKLAPNAKYLAGDGIDIISGNAEVPAEYQRVKYIQNSTNTYFRINGFHLTGDDIITCDIMPEGAATGWVTAWCSRVSTIQTTNTVFINVNDNTSVRTDYNNTQTTVSVTGTKNVSRTYRASAGNFFIDGTQKATRSTETFTTPDVLTIMASNENGNNIANFGYGKLYSFTVERGNTYVMKLLPCIRLNDSAVGLYDTVSDTFYTSTGTGTFLAGPNINVENDVVEVADGSVTAAKLNKASIIDIIYPVGSIYMSVNNVSPQSFLGGTWQAIEDRFLLAAGSTYTAGSTGGEATHKLVANELPKIQGTLPHVSHGEHKLTGVFSLDYGGASNYEGAYSSTSNNARYLMSFGNDQAHNNMPPYLTVYMWKRTA
jgi:hypothetical protein